MNATDCRWKYILIYFLGLVCNFRQAALFVVTVIRMRSGCNCVCRTTMIQFVIACYVVVPLVGAAF